VSNEAYSTVIDAVMFLAMVSACALILSMASPGARNAGDSGLRATASSTLASMESVRIDYFEYRILGDEADEVAGACGIDPGAWLYRDTARAVLGRGNRHKAVMEIAGEAAASQFDLRYGDSTLKLNPLTGDYHSQAQAAVDGYLRGRLDGRYGYNFTLRWVPFAGVPLEGSISCGGPAPPGAASASTYVTLPCRTNITREGVEGLIAADLEDVEAASMEYRAGGSEALFRQRLRASLGRCLENASRPAVEEVLGNTLYSPTNGAGGPLTAFSDNGSVSGGLALDGPGFDLNDALLLMIVQNGGEALDGLAGEIVDGINGGTLGPEEEKAMVVHWMAGRFDPSRARATLSVWVRTDA
jgi:hypothetical protein